YFQAHQIHQRKAHHSTPRERVTNPSIQWIRPVLIEAQNIRPRFHARQLPPQPRRTRPRQHHRQPREIGPAKPMRKQRKRQGTRRQKEHPYPYRPVRQPVNTRIPFPHLPFLGILHPSAVSHIRESRRASPHRQQTGQSSSKSGQPAPQPTPSSPHSRYTEDSRV